jgi:cytochrome c oxidase subunit II
MLMALGLAFSAPVIAQGTPTAATATATNATAVAPSATVDNAAAATDVKMAPVEYGSTDGGYSLVPQVTKNGEFALWFHNAILMPIIVAISIFVLGLLFWVAFRYRRSANPVPSKTSHNTLIEVIWTLVPVLILVGISIPSIGLLAAQYKPVGKNAITIKATGNQWFWSYTYPDHGDFEIVSNMLPDDQAKATGQPRLLAVDNRIVVPVGVPVRVLTTSNDVIHSFAVPAFWTKMDAVPGRINETSFTVEKPGIYYGQCSELCGARHGFMPIAVEAVSPTQFAQWIASKGGKMPGATPLAVSADGGQPVGMGVMPKVGDGTGKSEPSATPLATSNVTAPATK